VVAVTARPSGTASDGPARTPTGRRLAACAWGNRPSLGAWALLLGIPGGTQVVFGWPWWQAAAVQWALYAALWVAVTIADARQQAHDRQTGHQVPSHLSGTGEESPS